MRNCWNAVAYTAEREREREIGGGGERESRVQEWPSTGWRKRVRNPVGKRIGWGVGGYGGDQRDGGRELPLWSRTIVIGMAIRGLYGSKSGSLNFTFLHGSWPPCEHLQLMAPQQDVYYNIREYVRAALVATSGISVVQWFNCRNWETTLTWIYAGCRS